jgi:hypothetical protein
MKIHETYHEDYTTAEYLSAVKLVFFSSTEKLIYGYYISKNSYYRVDMQRS